MQEILGINCESDSVDVTGINSGDLYMAKRNNDWKLLTCRDYTSRRNVVFPMELYAYCYNGHECFRVLEN